MTYELTLVVRRYDPEKRRSWSQTYKLEAGRILRFTDLFRKINQEQDPTLAWNSSCEHAQCGSCGVKVNARPMLSCELLVEEAIRLFGKTTFTIEPLDVAPVIRDLVVDLEGAYRNIEMARPYVIDPAPPPEEQREHRIPPRYMDLYADATRCIQCFCCVAACISKNRTFLGPNAMLAAIVRAMDPREREKGQRERLLLGPKGVFRCHSARACTHVCPKGIDVAGFIAMAKRGLRSILMPST
jgi:succinate dehydrogenase / fumarate reductase iron-sulfur subunit